MISHLIHTRANFVRIWSVESPRIIPLKKDSRECDCQGMLARCKDQRNSRRRFSPLATILSLVGRTPWIPSQMRDNAHTNRRRIRRQTLYSHCKQCPRKCLRPIAESGPRNSHNCILHYRADMRVRGYAKISVHVGSRTSGLLYHSRPCWHWAISPFSDGA